MSGLIYDSRNQAGLEAVPHGGLPQDVAFNEREKKDTSSYADPLSPTSSHRICGLSTRVFWIAFVLALVVLGGAVGGGLAGGLVTARDNKGSSLTAQQQPTSSTVSSSNTVSTFFSTSISSAIPPSSTEPGTYRIVNIATNTAIDLLYGGTSNNTAITGWRWNPLDTTGAGFAHQAWQIASVGGGAIVILNTQTNSYITAPNLPASVNSTSESFAVYGGVPGSPTNPHMQWIMVQNDDNSVSFRSKAYIGKVLDLQAGQSMDGTPIILWESHGGLNQKWILVSP